PPPAPGRTCFTRSELACPGRATASVASRSEDPGPSARSDARSASRYCASRVLRWAPALVPLAQERSLHSPGTRELPRLMPAAQLGGAGGGEPAGALDRLGRGLDPPPPPPSCAA